MIVTLEVAHAAWLLTGYQALPQVNCQSFPDWRGSSEGVGEALSSSISVQLDERGGRLLFAPTWIRPPFLERSLFDSCGESEAT